MTVKGHIESAPLLGTLDQEIGVILRRSADQGPEWPLDKRLAYRTVPKGEIFSSLLPETRASGAFRLGETVFSLCGALAICGMGVERKGPAVLIPPVHAFMPILNICPTAAYTGRQRQPKSPSSTKSGSSKKNI